MKRYSHKFQIKEMAFVLEVSRSAYYAFISREESSRSKENRRLTSLIQKAYQKSRKIYGSPRIHRELISQGESCSRKRVAALMQKAHICAKMHRRKKITTISSKDTKSIAPNHLQQNFRMDEPNKVWVSDISYISTQEGWLYLSIVIDLFSRRVVGMSMGKSLHAELVIKSLRQALKHRRPSGRLLHHSDRGVQYTSRDFERLASQNGIELSMSAKGHCYDNAVAESFFHTLKTEHVKFNKYKTREEAMASLFEYVEMFYNRQRRHSTIGYLSPVEYEKIYEKQKVRVLVV